MYGDGPLDESFVQAQMKIATLEENLLSRPRYEIMTGGMATGGGEYKPTAHAPQRLLRLRHWGAAGAELSISLWPGCMGVVCRLAGLASPLAP